MNLDTLDEVDLNAILCESPADIHKRRKQERIELIDKINKTEMKYFLCEDPYESLYRISSFVLHSKESPIDVAKKILNIMNFNILYNDNKNWEIEIVNKFNITKNNFSKEKSNGADTIFKFILEKDIKDNIEIKDMIIPSKGNIQKIKAEEICFIFNSIIWNLQNKLGETQVLRQCYFLNDNFIKNYKKKTKRTLNSPKLSRITTLLNDAKLIKKTYSFTEGIFKTTETRYAIGEVGFYVKRLNKN